MSTLPDLAIRVFELSQSLEKKKWLTAGVAEKRKLLDLVFSNFRLDGVTLCYTIKKPFDIIAEWLLVPSNRGEKTAIELFIAGVRGWDAGLRRQFDAD